MSLTALAIAAGLGWAGSLPAAAAEIPDGITDIRVVEDSVGKYGKVTLALTWAAPDGSAAGDIITVQLPDVFAAVGDLSFSLDDSRGNIGATAVVKGRTMTITLTDRVESRVDVHGTAQVELWLDREVRAGTPYAVTFTAGAATFTDSIMIKSIDSTRYDERGHKWMVDHERPSDQDHRLHWGIIGPRIAGKYVNGTYIFTDYAQPGQAITCGEKVWSNIQLKLGDSYVDGNLVNAQHQSVQDVPRRLWQWNCTPEKMTVTFDSSAYPVAENLIPWVSGYSRVTDPTLTSYTNQAKIQVVGEFSQEIEVVTARAAGNGSWNGVTPPPTPTTPPAATAAPTASPPPTSSPTATTPPSTATSAPTGSPPPTATTPPTTPTTPPKTTPPPTTPPTPPKPKTLVLRKTFQVDTYDRSSAMLARALPRFLADKKLTYREDRPFWRYSRWEIVTVRVRADASPREVLQAINQATRRLPDVRTTSHRLPVSRGKATVAWQLHPRATLKHPWGPKHNLPQTFIARS